MGDQIWFQQHRAAVQVSRQRQMARRIVDELCQRIRLIARALRKKDRERHTVHARLWGKRNESRSDYIFVFQNTLGDVLADLALHIDDIVADHPV